MSVDRDVMRRWVKGDWDKGDWVKGWDKGDWDKGWLKADWGEIDIEFQNVEARRSALDRQERDGRRILATGWQPDIPDIRDRTKDHKDVQKILKKHDSIILKTAPIPTRHHNIAYCSPIEDQGQLGSCTAQAVVGLMEYMMRRSGVDHVDGSRLFVYKTTRKLLGWTGDTGAFLRTAMQSVVTFGIPPEKHWPYDISRYEEEPSAFLYSYASNYQALNYVRLDPSYLSQHQVLDLLKRVLAAGYCVVFGFSVYSSLSNAPDIPYPMSHDKLQGGHAVMAVGYDDDHMVKGKKVPSLIIRNSWGENWGVRGYGFLPYEYLLNGLARDFWSVFKWEWIDTKQFN